MLRTLIETIKQDYTTEARDERGRWTRGESTAEGNAPPRNRHERPVSVTTRLMQERADAISRPLKAGATPQERREHAFEHVQRAGKEQLDTRSFFRPEGKYHHEREAEHRRILEEMDRENATLPSHETPHAFLLSGLYGAGKSSSLQEPEVLKKSGILGRHPVYLSADDMKDRMIEHGMIPKVDDLHPHESIAVLGQREPSDIANAAFERAMAGRHDLVIDTASRSHEDITRRVQRLREHGYVVHGIHVSVTPEQAQENSLHRYERDEQAYLEGRGHGGIPIPDKAFTRQHEHEPGYLSWNHQVFMQSLDHFDHALVIDNMPRGDGFKPVVVMERGSV